MKLHESGEDYLEAILVLKKKIGDVRSVDLARQMEVSKPSVSHAVSVLREGGFITVDPRGYLELTESGRAIAESIYEKHCFFTRRLMEAGVEPEKAEKEACRIEHIISEDSFNKLKKHFR